MKAIIITIILFVTSMISGQSLSHDFKEPITTDNAETFKALVNDDNQNACFDGGQSSYSLLAITIKANAKDCFKVLLDKKVNLEKSCATKTPLMYAVKYGNLGMTKALIQAGANLKAENSNGKTALYYAEKYQQKEIATYLESLY